MCFWIPIYVPVVFLLLLKLGQEIVLLRLGKLGGSFESFYSRSPRLIVEKIWYSFPTPLLSGTSLPCHCVLTTYAMTTDLWKCWIKLICLLTHVFALPAFSKVKFVWRNWLQTTISYHLLFMELFIKIQFFYFSRQANKQIWSPCTSFDFALLHIL